MAKNDEPNMMRLLESMEKHGQKEAGEKYAEESPLEATADIDEKFVWTARADRNTSGSRA